MVYTPRIYLVSAAVAAVGLRMQQASAASMYYTTFTTSDNKNALGDSFSGAGTAVPDEVYEYVVSVDPTLPDISNISFVPTAYPELLANKTHDVPIMVSKKAGVAVLTVELSESQKALLLHKPPTTTPSTGAKHKDCATGWEKKPTTRKLAERGHNDQNRRLEAYSNKDLDRLEDFFNVTFETRLDKLPTESLDITIPWSGPYWPTVLDSLNWVWEKGQPSASQKYATAFGKDVKKFMDGISAKLGIDSRPNAARCVKNSDCATYGEGISCGKRPLKKEGRCIPEWFGICHAWSAAAIAESEPECPVLYNDVVFNVLDIKGLLTTVYDASYVKTIFTGARFRADSSETDIFGRSTDPAFRDMNPGFFHIVIANLLGIFGRPFVADVTAGREVWNQPVRGYFVYEQAAFSLQEAAQTFYDLEEYPWNKDAKSIVYMSTIVYWAIEAYDDGPLISSGRSLNYTGGENYYYLLEMDKDGKIIGGEWLYKSQEIHFDFLWLVREHPALDSVTSTGISYKDVSMLLTKSLECSDLPPGMTGDVHSTNSPATAAPEPSPPPMIGD